MSKTKSSKNVFQRPGPENIEITKPIVLKKLDGFPMFYEQWCKAEYDGKEMALSAAINGSAFYIVVGDAWYVLPMKDFAEKLFTGVYQAVYEDEK